MEKNGRSLAGETERRTGVGAALKRRGEARWRGSREGWLDCRSEFVLFHENNNLLSVTMKSSANGRFYRFARTPLIGACCPNRQLIDFSRSASWHPPIVPDSAKNRPNPCTTRHRSIPPPVIATRLHPTQTFPPHRGCALVATVQHPNPTCFPSVDRHF